MNKEKVAFLFAGQGSQKVGMGKDLYDSIPECKEIFDKAEEILDLPIKDMIFEGTEEELMLTENAQPAILVDSLAILEALRANDIDAKYYAGLSLGEYGALIAGGILSIEDGLRVVKERGKIMGSSLPKDLGKMAAILRLEESQVEEVIRQASDYGVCEGANYNCPKQVVISGTNEAIDKAVEIANSMGGRAKELKVSGPFHSSLLKNASEEFYKTVKNVNIGKVEGNVYSNTKGCLYEESDDVKLLLKEHIMSPVYFEKIIRDMIDKGVDTFIEVGPGKALSGFVKKVDRSLNILHVEDIDTLNLAISKLK
ncbi:MAG: ACP S-malonyltransferase [Clostridium sp.]|nr:ACP S-malonyltransferase [Clostridium sp.]